MSRTITLIAAVGAAFAVAAPSAVGKSQPVEPQWMQALEARSQELNRVYGLGEHSPAIRALKLRSEALNRTYGLGVYSASSVRIDEALRNPVQVETTGPSTTMLDGRERSFAAGREGQPMSMLDSRERAFAAKREVQLSNGTPPDAFERAVGNRGTGSLDQFIANDNRFRVTPVNDPVEVAATGSGDEIEWPQIGIGFGVGIALALGLLLGLRATRHQTLAH
jgi:opacity protein-like surface antigen